MTIIDQPDKEEEEESSGSFAGLLKRGVLLSVGFRAALC